MAQLSERKINYKHKIKDYRGFDPVVNRSIQKQKTALKGKVIIHINSTPEGGGVAELLVSQVALEQSLGLNSHWFYVEASSEFFRVTKKIHNLLQGMRGQLTRLEQKIYLDTNRKFAELLARVAGHLKPDIIVIHDPQPLPIIDSFSEKSKLILRLHIDLSEPNQWMINFLKPYLVNYGRVIVSGQDFVSVLPKYIRRRTTVILPAIDPLSEKNLPMGRQRAEQIMKKLGLHPSRPCVSQVSRFDPWKDPSGALDVYLLAKKELPDLQLVLAGIIHAKDDPQAWSVLEKVRRRVQGHPGIFLFWDQGQIRPYSIDTFISAVFTASSVIIQRSIKEGFGLTITEAMWKAKPIIGNNAHGVRLQIQDGKNGIIAANRSKAAQALIKLVKNTKLNRRIGRAAQASVRKNFLLPRFILDNLRVYKKLT